MLDKENHINELYTLKHINDKENINYENKLITKLHSTYIFKNDITNEYLLKFEKFYIIMLETNLLVRNWFNFTKDKYNNDYQN